MLKSKARLRRTFSSILELNNAMQTRASVGQRRLLGFSFRNISHDANSRLMTIYYAANICL